MIDAALLLPTILARAGDNAELNETAVKIAWRRVAGEGLRNHAAPSRLQARTLVVSVADAVWQKQLQAMSTELIFRVNKLLRRRLVESIEFRIDPRGLGQNTTNRSAARVCEPAPASVVSSAEDIEDPELRKRFLRAAEKCIDRRDTIKPAIEVARASRP